MRVRQAFWIVATKTHFAACAMYRLQTLHQHCTVAAHWGRYRYRQKLLVMRPSIWDPLCGIDTTRPTRYRLRCMSSVRPSVRPSAWPALTPNWERKSAINKPRIDRTDARVMCNQPTHQTTPSPLLLTDSKFHFLRLAVSAIASLS